MPNSFKVLKGRKKDTDNAVRNNPFIGAKKMTTAKNNSTHQDETSEELGFNEAELQDIMSEIENLEKEFTDTGHEEETSRSDLAISPEASLKISPSELAKNELQRQIDEELENSLKRLEGSEPPTAMGNETGHEDLHEVDKILDEVDDNTDAFSTMEENEVVHETYYEEKVSSDSSNVVNFTKETQGSSATHEMPVSFQAEGTMSLKMSFKVGESEAKLSVMGDKGLVLFFEGVEVKLSEDHGCVVEMQNGIKFNIPLKSSSGVHTKKNVA